MEKAWKSEQEKQEESLERKMIAMLELSMKTTFIGTSLSYDNLCMRPNLDLPKGFKVPHFELFNGIGNPKAYIWAYCDQLVGVRNNQVLIMKLFTQSLTGEASEWFTTQDRCRWITWEDMAAAFMEKFLFNMETTLEGYYLEKVKQKSTENFREYASRWRIEAARIQQPTGEKELVLVFIRSQEIDFYDRMLSISRRPLSELVKMGEAVEDGLKTGRIISMIEKSIGSSSTEFIKKQKGGNHIPHS
ncbi:uncharacterized protein LOC132054260 [Lycium ferocissimum]|uniref:uncharacterized protein LOC132054260 n=1 Tax=Lycium ferocissimum TaxID=112874 RepID=UPI002815D325|nr:uncharacterized protein LOC132054260 [Lycium ferocissimum]